MMALRDVQANGVSAVCTTDSGVFPYGALRVDAFGDVWHDGSEFDGDIICHGPFTIHALSAIGRTVTDGVAQ